MFVIPTEVGIYAFKEMDPDFRRDDG